MSNRHRREARAYQAAGLLHDIASASHVIEVGLARLLYLMVQTRGYKRLGHVSFKSYVRQGLRQNGLRRFEYLVAIQKAIEGSPDKPPMEELGRRWRRGRVAVSQAKQMIAMTRNGDQSDPKPPVIEANDEAWDRRQFLATHAQDSAWRVAIETCRRVEGADIPVAQCVDDLLAEFSSSVPLDTGVPAFLPEDERDEAHRAARSMGEAAEMLKDIRRYAEDVKLGVDPLEGLSVDVADMDRRIRWLLRLEGNVAWHRCRLLCTMARLGLHRPLGYRTLSDYARQALDCSPASLGFHLGLARRLEGLRRVAEAFRCGLITALEAAEICKVAIPTTQADWIARARTCTLASLQEDVDCVLSQGVEGGLPPQRPTNPPALAWEPAPQPGSRQKIQRCAARVGRAALIPMAGRAEVWYQALSENAEELLGQLMSPEGPKKKVSFSAPVSVCRAWDIALARIRALLDRLLLDGQCVAVMLADFLKVWGKKSSRDSVLVRDGWKCQAPGCTKRAQLHAHHIVYRSHGGPDDRWNLVTVCLRHHAMIHAGIIRVTGRAAAGLTWEMGRERWSNGIRVWGDPEWSAAGPMPAVQSQINWVRQRS